MSRKSFEDVYLESVHDGQTKVSECMRKFTRQHLKDPQFVPEDYGCLSRISSHWSKINVLCSSSKGCEKMPDRQGWEGQHKHFVGVLGHHWEGKWDFFRPEFFDEKKVFAK